jgi:hypothetical protein
MDQPAIVRQLPAEELPDAKLLNVKTLTGNADPLAAAKMSLRPLGLDKAGEIQDAVVVLTEKQIQGQPSAAGVFATRQMDVNGDGQIAAGELRRFAFAADQLGNKDGKLGLEEYNRLFSIGQQAHLIELGKQVGLSAESLDRLERRLASGKFGLSGMGGLPDALDVARMSSDPLVTAQKTVTFIGLFESALAQVPKESRTALTAVVLEHLATTGITLIPVPSKDNAALTLVGDSVVVSQGRGSSTEYRYKSEEFRFSYATKELTLQDTQISKTSLVLLDERHYNLQAGDPNPFVERAIKDFKDGVANDREFKDALNDFLAAPESDLLNRTELEKLLQPIHTQLQKLLGTPRESPFKVEVRDPESQSAGAVYSHPKPGTNEQPSIRLFILPYASAFRETYESLVRSGGLGPQDAQNQAAANLRQSILLSLVEENFHALQHQLTDKHLADSKQTDATIAPRMADYALNREFLVSPVDLANFVGDLKAYETQPFEADAKRFRLEVVNWLRTRGGVNPAR